MIVIIALIAEQKWMHKDRSEDIRMLYMSDMGIKEILIGMGVWAMIYVWTKLWW